MYFKIVPNISILLYSGSHVNDSEDIAIRESIVNVIGKLDFSWKPFSPIKNHGQSDLTEHVMIAQDPSTLKTSPFSTLLSNST